MPKRGPKVKQIVKLLSEGMGENPFPWKVRGSALSCGSSCRPALPTPALAGAPAAVPGASMFAILCPRLSSPAEAKQPHAEADRQAVQGEEGADCAAGVAGCATAAVTAAGVWHACCCQQQRSSRLCIHTSVASRTIIHL